MQISDLTFHESDFVGKDVASLPDQVIGSAAELKARFDRVAKEMIALGRFNDLIALLTGSAAAGQLGFAATEAVPADTVQQAVETLSRQLRSVLLGALPAGSVTADRLAPGAAAGNLAAGSVAAAQLAPGAALENIGPGGVTRAYLADSLAESLKSAVQLESITTAVQAQRLDAAHQSLSLALSLDLRHFLSGSGGRVVVRMGWDGWQCSELEIRHDPGGSGLHCVLRGGCAASAAPAPQDTWQAVWRPAGGAVCYHNGTHFLGLHCLLEAPDPSDRLLTPVLEETRLTLPFTTAATAERLLQTQLQAEVWR